MVQYYKKACLCEYLGTNYSGWQRQNNGIGIQNIIEAGLSKIHNENILIFGSGRTDKGVHAYGQVFHFISNKYIKNSNIVKGVNSLLPDDISIIKCIDVNNDFHALRSAISKSYQYKILNKDTRSAISFNKTLWINKKIDIHLLNLHLQEIIGTHDFTSFCTTKNLKEYTIRTVNYIKVNKTNNKIIITINANGFMHNMVRIIIGTALQLTCDNQPLGKIKEIIKAKDRTKAGKTVAAHGLYLYRVYYNQDYFKDNMQI